jgi:hypothetical protein
MSWLLWLYGQGLQQAATWIVVVVGGTLGVIWTAAAALRDQHREDEDEREH